MAQQTADFLVEIGCEELPPKALKVLSEAFLAGIETGLQAASLTYACSVAYATPRRLAVLVKTLVAQQPDQTITRKGPALSAAFTADGKPTPACLGFARSCGVAVDQLQQQETAKGSWLAYDETKTGQHVNELLPAIVQQAIVQLPIPKRMRWGDRSEEFVRPAHWLVMLYGEQVIPSTILGLTAGRETYGHRFHHPQSITLHHPEEYAHKLEEQGYVIPSFHIRRSKIQEQILQCAQQLQAQAVINDALLDEVTALVEWPVALTAAFDQRLLAVPAEALISAMQDHQKSFHVTDEQGTLLPHFITISNIESRDRNTVIVGNERVMRARLADAEFFYLTDLKHSLESFAERLKQVVFQAKLGTLHEKSQRVAKLAAAIATELKSDAVLAERAGQLCKADLMSDMVGEFPELQGTMGYYYAQHAHEPSAVALALKEHYLPRFAKDELPTNATSYAVAIADRLDTLVGIFGINQPPSGEKDPFALRRAAIGLLRIIIEKQLPLDLKQLLTTAAELYQGQLANQQVVDDCFIFILDRLKTWYQEQGIGAQVFAAVKVKLPSQPLDFQQRIQAVEHFRTLPEAAALAAANKRVSKLLLKENKADINRNICPELLQDEAEKQLAQLILSKHKEVTPLFTNAQYSEALTCLASLQTPVNQFFDEVMVMVDDKKIRDNRLALLANLRDLFLHVADISLL